MKVYLLYAHDPITMGFEAPYMKAIYSTKESAERAAKVLEEIGDYKYSVSEMKVIE